MQINKIDNTNFTARNATIRRADDIVRLARKAFPMISSSKIDTFKNISSFKGLLLKTSRDLNEERFRRSDRIDSHKSVAGKVFVLLESLRTKKLGNCAEHAEVALLAAKFNGIKNAYLASLMTPDKKPLDHCVILVEDKKPYIIDGWLGFADYVPEAKKRWQKEYKYMFDFEEAKTEKINIIKRRETLYDTFLENDFPEFDEEVIKEIYPELVLKNANK